VDDLDEASHRSSDPPDGPSLAIVNPSFTGRRGRPRLNIDPTFLAYSLELRGPKALASILNCSSRTIRRRALEEGFVEPGFPVLQATAAPDGSLTMEHTSGTPSMSYLSDEELDQKVAQILEIFPNFGRSMISGHLRADGHRVPTSRIRLSYVRVHGSPGAFGQRQIARRKYSVPGPNSLWHHDGQHGMSTILIPLHFLVTS
jgi:hypothetical protein